MNIKDFVFGNEKPVMPDNELLQYCGRIGKAECGDPEFVFACSFVRWRFKGTSAAVVLTNSRYYWNSYAGCIVDGEQKKFELPEEGTVRLELATQLEDKEHEIVFFKRMDACHSFVLHGIVLNEEAELIGQEPLPDRRIEVFGDSVSAGEVSEAVDYVGESDPEHNGEYSNSWYSYSWLTARKLNAQLHNNAQGGIALLPGTGWFAGPDFMGLEQTYDKIKYYPDYENATQWDFSKYIPHVVIVAIGQNDANPEDYMKTDYEGEKAENWRSHYRSFLLRLRELYPAAYIITATTVLRHDPAWDRAIDEVTRGLDDDRISHFLYSRNGDATPGHIRIPEAIEMADELAAYIEGLGEEVWK